jgi:hypothetical protein
MYCVGRRRLSPPPPTHTHTRARARLIIARISLLGVCEATINHPQCQHLAFQSNSWDQVSDTAFRTAHCWSFATARAPISSYLSSNNVSVLSFCSAWNTSFEIFPLFCGRNCWHEISFHKTSGDIISSTLCKSMANENILWYDEGSVRWVHLVGIWFPARREARSKVRPRRSGLPGAGWVS